MGWTRHRTRVRRLVHTTVIIYLTYNDAPSGVYWSQVTEVVDQLNDLGDAHVRLVAFVSARGFRDTRRSIKQHSPAAWVLPMVPTMRFWRWNMVLFTFVCMWFRPSGIMARGVFGTWMAQRAKAMGLTRKVCFDARGAYAAEWEEYRLIDDDALIAQFRPLEHAAVHASDMRLAVSHALVAHWAERYAWQGGEYVVVPCTLGKDHKRVDRPVSDHAKTTAGQEQEVVLVYSGSTAVWQSFQLLNDLLGALLSSQQYVRVLFLSRPDPNNAALQARFPGRVDVRWVGANEVGGLLAACDLGLLIREDTITNRVASPTKFAEYLAAGLPVVISPHIGDFSAYVSANDLGVVLGATNALPTLRPTDQHVARRMQDHAYTHLGKSAFTREYERVLKVLS